MEKTTYLSPDDIELLDGPDYDVPGYVQWQRTEWSGPGNPSWIRRGIWVTAVVHGEHIWREAIEGAGWRDPEVEETVAKARLAVVGAEGRARLQRLREDVDALDGGWAGTWYDPRVRGLEGDAADQLREERERHFGDISRCYDNDLALGKTPSASRTELVTATREALAANRAEIDKGLERYAHAWWDLLVHLTRLGVAVTDIARWLDTSPEIVRKKQTQVSVRFAAHLFGVQPSTWRSYVARGQAPAPDDQIGREPVWELATLLTHERDRHGRVGRPPKS